MICRQGTVGDAFYIIVEGLCSVTLLDAKKNTSIEVSTLQSGEFFGERALVAEMNIRTASVIGIYCIVLTICALGLTSCV